MHKNVIWSKFALRVYLAVALLFSSLAYAVSTNHSPVPNIENYSSPAAINGINSIAPTPGITPSPNDQTNAAAISSSQLGWNGPFSFGIARDSLYNYTWDVQYTQKLNDNFALSGLFEYASDMYRFGGTVGVIFFDDNFFKFSAERLSEVLPFDFDSGNLNERVAQDAFGARYEHSLNNWFWKNIDIGGFYSKAHSKKLAPVFMTLEGANVVNYRNIAGGTSKGFDVGSVFDLTKFTEFNVHLYYDLVDFDTINMDSTSDSSGVGWSVGLNQLIGKHLMIGGEASKRKLYNTYTANISWLPPSLAKLGFEISLLAERLISNNQMPHSDSIGLKLTFSPNTIRANDSYYQLPGKHTVGDIGIWTSKPAVHMAQVLAIADQKTVALAPVITSIAPTSASAAGGALIVINGNNFVGTTGVTFGGVPATSFLVQSPNVLEVQSPPHAAGVVDLVVTNPGGSATTQFTYTVTTDSSTLTSPLISAIAPASGQLGQAVTATISGKNFVPGAKVKFGSVLAAVNSISADKVVVSLPAFNGASGKIDVTVTNPDGTSAKSPGAFTYVGTQDATKPNQLANGCTAYISPAVGSTPAGNVVTIHNGSGFTAATTVEVFYPPNLYKSIPGSPGSSINSISPDGTSITFTLPAGGVGYAYISTLNPATCNQPFPFYYRGVNKFAIQSSAGANGTISPLGVTTVDPGSSLTYTMLPNVGYMVQNVLVDGVSVGAVSSYTFSNIQADHTISVTFTIATHTITASAGSGGSISPSGVVTVNYGTSQSFTITPDSCHDIGTVLVDGSPASLDEHNQYTFGSVINNHTILATFIPKTSTITATAGTGGSISPSGTVPVNCGEDQTFNVIVNSGYAISDVKVDGSSMGAIASYTFTNVTANHTIDVQFVSAPPSGYHITVTAGSGGSISPGGVVTVASGDSQTFTITADSCHTIANVVVDGFPVGATSSYTFNNVIMDHTISATFSANGPYTITSSVTAGSGTGTITPLGAVSVNCEDSQTFFISPTLGSHITDVSVDGSSVGTPSSYTFNNVSANHSIAATFAIDTHTIIATAGPNGSISNPGVNTVNFGSSLGFTITPNGGYHIADVIVDDVSQGPITSYTFTNVASPHTIHATFVGSTVTIEASASSGGSISPSGTIALSFNASSPTFVMTSEDEDDVLLDVIVDGVSVGPVPSYTFGPHVTANHTIFAKFLFHSAMVITLPTNHGQITPIGTIVYREDSDPVYTITADPGYVIGSVLVDGQPISLNPGLTTFSYTFEEIEETHTIGATFILAHHAEAAVTPSATVMTDFFHTYRRVVSDILEISPDYGSNLGGDEVTINFSKFKKPPTKITFGGVVAEIVRAGQDKVTVKTPPHKPGKVDIEISNANESAALQHKFNYLRR